jgi:hypothetical protein
VQGFQLTVAQQAMLDHQSRLASSPREIVEVLQLTSSEEREGLLAGRITMRLLLTKADWLMAVRDAS